MVIVNKFIFIVEVLIKVIDGVNLKVVVWFLIYIFNIIVVNIVWF